MTWGLTEWLSLHSPDRCNVSCKKKSKLKVDE